MAMNQRTLRYLVAGLCFAVILSLLYFRDADNDARRSAAPVSGVASQTQSPTLHRNAEGKVIGAEFYSTDVSPEQIVALREHAMLQEILFYECRGIDELVDAELIKSESLTSIHFVRSTIDDNSLARLSKIPAVEELTLANVDVTATGMAALGNWSKLKRLTLEGKIEMSALKGLSGLEQLEELEIAIGEVKLSILPHMHFLNFAVSVFRIPNLGTRTLPCFLSGRRWRFLSFPRGTSPIPASLNSVSSRP